MLTLQEKKHRREPITILTAYDCSTARLIDETGIDAILVGDSLAMVVLGMNDTLAVTMDEMLHHARAVSRGARRCLLIGDMPFLSYQADRASAVHNAGLFLKTGGMNAVKLEGGRAVADTVRAIVAAGIPVMGHIGLTPQSQNALGGFRVQARSADAALMLLEDAQALQDAGCFAIVIESVPEKVAALISARLDIPTIGIGAGSGVDGQVLVINDVLGLYQELTPKFVKRYANLGETIRQAIEAYRGDVERRVFPAAEHTYAMPTEEWERFQAAANRARALVQPILKRG
ncbi:MAG: 3-methyl-2-oxobutanoate hydroxymethyltransferase [Vicinamibacteria bacterium]|nr:3-methyl-2-oxobutanoate hydroxymethyltransferase [Vicinamibacteria bacterium]